MDHDLGGSRRGDGQLEPNEALELVHPGMTVVDRNDSKIGEVQQVYRPVSVDEQDSMSYDAYVRVGHRGMFGLAKDLYVPARFVSSVIGDIVRLEVDKHQIPDFVWDQPVPLPGKNH